MTKDTDSWLVGLDLEFIRRHFGAEFPRGAKSFFSGLMHFLLDKDSRKALIVYVHVAVYVHIARCRRGQCHETPCSHHEVLLLSPC